MSKMLVNRIGLTISLLGIVSSAILKNWVAVGLWIVIMIQDFRIISLENEIEDL